MPEAPLFVMIGGFLGAGKTTTVGRLAAMFRAQGKNVAIVTNDQATDLVDTNLLRSQGFEVGEVAGSCFCCNFNELTDTMQRLSKDRLPDVILAEPVGSCTDLVATVLRPLQQIYDVPFQLAPFGVIVKHSHGQRILSGGKRRGFSPQAEYIFLKQLEEADFLIVNRADQLTDQQMSELEKLIDNQFPERQILRVSALTGEGFDDLFQLLQHDPQAGRRAIEVDYDVYAEGEAELGWLNCQIKLTAASPFELDEFLQAILGTLSQQLADADAETAHLKAIGMWEGAYAVANLISSDDEPTLSLSSGYSTQEANVVVNARVAVAPESLTEVVRQSVAQVAAPLGIQADITSLQSFRPGRPVPTHRITNS